MSLSRSARALAILLLVVFAGFLVLVGCGRDHDPDLEGADPVGIVTGKITRRPSTASVASVRLAEGEDALGIADAEVWLEERPDIRTRTNQDGIYVLEKVPAGKFHVVAKAGGATMVWKMRSPEQTSVGDAAPATVDLVLSPATVRLVGILRDANGVPLAAGTKLMLWGETFQVEEGGRFETPPLPEGFIQNEITAFLGSSFEGVKFGLDFIPAQTPVAVELTLPVTQQGRGTGKFLHPPGDPSRLRR
jgi:hypothetical protein